LSDLPSSRPFFCSIYTALSSLWEVTRSTTPEIGSRTCLLRVASNSDDVHTPSMTLKNAALLALIGTILMTALSVWTFILTLLSVLRDLVPAVTVFQSFIYAFGCFSVTVFFYVCHRAQKS
jgi:hypothetical protein